jgi:predicted amidohydrolase YtcJ
VARDVVAAFLFASWALSSLPRARGVGRLCSTTSVAFALACAGAAWQETDLGSLEPGTRADLVLLSDDVFTCGESDVKDVAPVLTMVGGEAVFQRAGLREEMERP